MDNWSDEVFCLLCEKLSSRKQRELDAIRGRRTELQSEPGPKVVKDADLFELAGEKIKVVKSHGN
jgi:hypothetical protein